MLPGWPRSWLRPTRTTSRGTPCWSMVAFCGHTQSNKYLGSCLITGSEGCMRNDIRLVIADVDGTLVTQDKMLTPRAIASVQRLGEMGIAFSITSGRPPLGMKMLIDPLNLTEPLAAFNGGVFVQPDLSVMSQSFVSRDIAT